MNCCSRALRASGEKPRDLTGDLDHPAAEIRNPLAQLGYALVLFRRCFDGRNELVERRRVRYLRAKRREIDVGIVEERRLALRKFLVYSCLGATGEAPHSTRWIICHC